MSETEQIETEQISAVATTVKTEAKVDPSSIFDENPEE